MNLSRRLASIGAVTALAAVSGLALRAAPIKRVEFSDTRLKNGLRVIISEDHTAPVFAIAVNYDVGSRDERKGRTGFAHLFEHMMFKGSENVGPGEHPYLMFMYGGSMNGTTNKERTLYLRDPAVQSARPRAVPRGRPDAVAGDHEGGARQPDQRGPGGAPPAAWTTSRTDAPSRSSTSSPTTTSRTSTRSSARWRI